MRLSSRSGILTANAGMLLILIGCATKQPSPRPPVFEHTDVPAALMSVCPVEPPPDVDSYEEASWTEKEKLLIDMNTKQLLNLDICNARVRALQIWNLKQKILYQSSPGVKNAG